MRHLHCLLFLFAALAVSAQSPLPVTWKTDRGIVDTGHLVPLPPNLYEEDKLKLILKHGQKIEVSQHILDWVVYEGDTLLLRRTVDDESRLLQLLYQGPVRLYKVIREREQRQYFLVKGTRWESLGRWDAARVGQAFQTSECRHYKYPETIDNDRQAVELTRRINDCLDIAPHQAMPGSELRHSRFGIIVNQTVRRFSEYDDRRFSVRNAARNINEVYERPFYAPGFLLSYQREVIRYLPNLKARLDVGFLHRNMTAETLLRENVSQADFPVEEVQRINALYFYPGIQCETSPYRALKFSFGIGPAFALPLKTERRVTILPNPTAWPGPQVQEISNFIDTDLGFHLDCGVQVQVYPRIWLELAFRHEEMEKRTNFSAATRSNIYYTDLFTPNILEGTKRMRWWQFGVHYDY